MDDRETTVRSRELGDALRRAMRNAGYNGREIARRLGWPHPNVSRLLSGKRGGAEIDVATFLAVCGVKGEERARLLGLCGELRKLGWFQQHGSRLPKQLETLMRLERQADSFCEFQPMVVPGLLQTPSYAQALLTGTGTLPVEEIDGRVLARMERKSLFEPPKRARFSFFLHEFALRLPVGGNEVMSEQLHHLLEMAVRFNVTIRVIPAVIGAHAAIAGQFKMMEFPEFNPVVYLDSETASLFLEEPGEIAAYRRVSETLATTALDEGESKDAIAALAVELYS
ncbi:helix-turn-helix transcriptional regulator [Amycolatopsis sp.]|jgi:transcriptional regulator with XRE-family HTH domain|uniref:helix-turn-helix domain-containing protein n=1 Tax=Amycolatopsis sp. TaxID=37632 RepID=UPI002DF8B16C|nr:helix-turn-helix transcriptional regulator [Amycolatopsis sp.]